jgi:hypothetical protein
MHVAERFRFDHEAGDDARTTAELEAFRRAGIELGAAVTVYYCPICDVADADFDYEGAT